ncbi:DUF4352 domain-containing protein [Streptomyces sp. ISL-86]|uniref:DUF4352 domain-containing protein n=1 Tax=Streptomyces sp. ISL-86 TaxID=2819187 RepID=UPI001BE874CD|nr:DUF4352 domain-containing protein [Streptomyces sp. ISL-86]MBT2458360.1 DUF4352 domain-containing protein [Streptomyces sp. ISL-86]
MPQISAAGPFTPPGGANPWGPPAGLGQGPGYGPGYGPGGPAHPGYAGYPGYPYAAPPPSNGLAVAALICGIFAVLVGLVPFLFWGGALLAAAAIGLGIGGIVRAAAGNPRKTMAIVGTVLGVLGIGASIGGYFLTHALIERVDKEVSREFEDLDDLDGLGPTYAPPEPAPKPSPSDIPGKTSALPWGKTFTYPDGVEVTVRDAVAFTPGKNSYPREHSGHGVKVTVKIVNNSTAAIDVTTALPHARDDQGAETELVFDGTVPKLFKGSVLPGESATGIFSFTVPEGTKSLHFEMSPGLPTKYGPAIWSGPIG